MGLLSFLGLQREKAALPDPKYFARVFDALGFALAPATPILKEKIPEWNLSSVPLLQALGYICGFVDAAYQALGFQYDEPFVEQLFLLAVERHLGWVPKIDVFLHFAKRMRTGHISGLLGEPGFRPGMLAGGDDFVRCSNDRLLKPLGLYLLLAETLVTPD